MNLNDYLKSWKGSLSENRFNRWIIMGLAIANLMMVGMLAGENETVVMIPPGIDRRVEIGANEGSPGIKEQWALHIAMLVGNATPKNAPYLSEQLGNLMSPRLYSTLQESLAEQARKLEADGLSVQFTPNTVFHLPTRDVVVVSGEHVLRGQRGSDKTTIWTYELKVSIRNYMVRIDGLESYEGPWNAQKEAERLNNNGDV